MNFEELNNLIPYAKGGKQKILRMSPYPGIKLAMPGRHADQTKPIGGDFVVMVTDKAKGWRDHQFNHSDIFLDLEAKDAFDVTMANDTMLGYRSVIQGGDPDKYTLSGWTSAGDTVHPRIFLRAVQCLAVAEHRRYAQFENKFGGRYLPFRFATGIAEGLWTAAEAKEKERMGRPGVEWLEQSQGIPTLTKELMGL